MSPVPEEMLNLIRISDTFFPLGSYTVSQGMEQLVTDNLATKDRIYDIISVYLEKIWKSFDLQIFFFALQAARNNDIDALLELDRFCFASKIAEESRISTQKTGFNLANAMEFREHTVGISYKQMIKTGKAPGMYPIVLALVARELNVNEQGGLSLIYVNLIEVVASLVRLAEIDYLYAQEIMSDQITGIDLPVKQFPDLHQSCPIVDIASMRHEKNTHRMFIS